jgi:hypothetical protein
MKEAIRKKRPQQYPGQDIEKMATEYTCLAKEIDNAGYYSQSLTLNMVDGFLCASHDAKGTFHHTMNTLQEKVSALEQKTKVLPKLNSVTRMSASMLSKSTMKFAVTTYGNQASFLRIVVHLQQISPRLRFSILFKALVEISVATSNLLPISMKRRKVLGGASMDHQYKDCPQPKLSLDQAKTK